MTLYRYRAVDGDCHLVSGRLEAASLADLEVRLRRRGQDLVSGRAALGTGLQRPRISRRELANFYFHLEQLARSGVPLPDGLRDLRDSLDAPRERSLAAALAADVEGGQTLSEALAANPDAFGPVHVHLVRAGEAAGKLPEVLAGLAEAVRHDDEAAAELRQTLAYPAVVAIAVLAALAFLMVHLVPQLKVFLSHLGQVPPLHTQLLFFVSDLAVRAWPALPIAILAAGLSAPLVIQGRPAVRLRLDGLILRLPLAGAILKKAILARLAGTLALLYAAGVPILDSLRILRGAAGNRVVAGALEEIEATVRDGRRLAGAFEDTGLFPPFVVRMLRVGETTGNLDTALENVRYFYQRDVREAAARARTLAQPVTTLILGALLAWIALAVVGPIYEVAGRVRL